MPKTERPWISHYPSQTPIEISEIEHASLAHMIRDRAREYKKKKAFVTCMPNGMNGTLSFEKVNRLSDAFAVYLREKVGLKAGDRVAIQMPNCLAYPIVAFGTFKAGCVLVNTNPLYTSNEMKHQFKDADIKAIIITDMFVDKLEALHPELPIKNIIVSRIPDFFPLPVAKVIHLIQKYWNKQIPKHNLPHSSLQQAIAWGEKNLSPDKLDSYLVETQLDSIAVLQYTGGTTGVSKGAMLTHRNLLSNCEQVLEMLQDKIERGQECVLSALPLYHIFAFSVNLLVFYSVGGKNILTPSPRPLSNLKRALENYPITWITGVNTLFSGLCNEIWFSDSPPKHLKAAAAGGMALQSAVAERWQKVTGVPVVEGYGLTEASPVITFNPFGKNLKAKSIGIPLPSTDVRCVKENGEIAAIGEAGELQAKGPQIMKGYWQQNQETQKALDSDGWLKTGDIAIMSDDGYFEIVDRKKDMILVSGFNVFPNEIEDCLAKNTKILEAAVIGVPNPDGSETVKAYVVKKDPSLSQDEVIQHCKQYLTAYKIPKLVEFRSDLPKTPVGKILRKDLRKELSHGE
jgi:long-chain acyl-CoA synthetase